MKIDSHQHFWEINDTDYVWMGEEHAVIKRDFLPADLRPLLADSGLDGCVAVQARQMTVETDWLLALAASHDLIRGVVGWVPLCEQAGEPWLEKYAGMPGLVGVRHVVHDEPDDNFILRADFNEGVSRLKNYGLTYDILIFGRHLPQTIEFVDRHPGQAMVVDHIAKPVIRAGNFDEAWSRGIRELARRGQVMCKLSGVVTEIRDPTWDIDLIQPYFDTVIEAFGADRIMFGSDWPVCLLRADYSRWVEVVQQLLAPLSEHEQAAILGGNAVRFYGLT